MIRLQIVGGNLQISNEGVVILVAPKNSCAIDVLALYDAIPTIVIYNKYLGNSTNIFTQPLANCEDLNGTPFTIGSFTLFAEVNIGFDVLNPNYGLYSQTSDSTPVTTTTSELSLIGSGVGTLSVPANSFTIGGSFNANMSGLMSVRNNDTITIRIKSGSVVLADSGALIMPNITNQVWNLSMDFTIRAIGGINVASIVTFGQFHVLKNASGTQEGFGFNYVNNTTFDTTIPNTLSITAQWSNNSDLNSIYTDIFILNKIF